MQRLQTIENTSFQPIAPKISDVEGKAMGRAVVSLFDRWGLTDAQACVLLGEMSPRTWARWKVGAIGRVPRDLKARLSCLMGIHKALRIIFKDAERGYGWINRANDAFGGASARDIMLGGELTDIMRVRRYLDSVRVVELGCAKCRSRNLGKDTSHHKVALPACRSLRGHC